MQFEKCSNFCPNNFKFCAVKKNNIISLIKLFPCSYEILNVPNEKITLLWKSFFSVVLWVTQKYYWQFPIFFFFFFFWNHFLVRGFIFQWRVPHVGGIGFDPMSPPPTRGFSWGRPLTIFADHWTTNDLKVTRHNKSMTIIHFFLSEIIFCEKKLKLYGPFLWMVFNCLKASATSRRQFTFYP